MREGKALNPRPIRRFEQWPEFLAAPERGKKKKETKADIAVMAWSFVGPSIPALDRLPRKACQSKARFGREAIRNTRH